MKNPILQERKNEKTGRIQVRTINTEKSETQQQFKEECDINNIVKKFSTTGEFTHLTRKQGTYQDFSEITDYQTMLHQVQYAEEAFASLPATIRARFRNDPGELLSFIQNEKNYDEAVTLGLIEPKPSQITDPQITVTQTQTEPQTQTQTKPKTKNKTQTQTDPEE